MVNVGVIRGAGSNGVCMCVFESVIYKSRI